MPYTISWDGHGLIKRMHGFVTAEEFMESANACTSHPQLDDAKYVINDFTDVTGNNLDSVAMEHVAVMRLGASQSKRNLRILFVSPDPSIHAFVAALTAPPFDGAWETRVFDTLPQAMDWLGRQPPLPSGLLRGSSS